MSELGLNPGPRPITTRKPRGGSHARSRRIEAIHRDPAMSAADNEPRPAAEADSTGRRALGRPTPEPAQDAIPATRRDLVAVHNALLKAIQSTPQAGPAAPPAPSDGDLRRLLAELSDATLRMEAQLTVGLRSEVQRAVRDVVGPEVLAKTVGRQRPAYRLLWISILLNCVLALCVVALVAPQLLIELQR